MSTLTHPPSEGGARTKVGVGHAQSAGGQHTAQPGQGPRGPTGGGQKLCIQVYPVRGGAARESTENLRLRRALCWGVTGPETREDPVSGLWVEDEVREREWRAEDGSSGVDNCFVLSRV